MTTTPTVGIVSLAKVLAQSKILLCFSYVIFFTSLFGNDPPEVESAAGAIAPQIEQRYILSPSDTVNVSIYQQPDLSSTQRISEIGTIALPLVGEIRVANLNKLQAQTAIADAYIDKHFLVNPIITIQIEKFAPKTVVVLGEVSSPGQIQLPDGSQGIRIQELIAMVGDFSDIAKKDRVRIERRSIKSKAPEVFFLDVESIIESDTIKKNSEDFIILPGDIIFVPRRMF